MITIHHEILLESVGPVLSMGPMWACVVRGVVGAVVLGASGVVVASWGVLGALVNQLKEQG